MKLEKILDNLNSFEKNSFLKIIDNILSANPKDAIAVEKLLAQTNGDLKSMDNVNISNVFKLVEHEFAESIKTEFQNTSSQLDILIDIISRDGNCIMKQDWFARLYEKELKGLDKKLKDFKKELISEKSEFNEQRKRDYQVYKACLTTAYKNDQENNLQNKITSDELSILLTLSKELGLSQEEVKLINYLIIPVNKLDIDNLINELKLIGVVFYSKKTSTIYVADEMVRLLRKVRGKAVADKFYRRVLRLLKESQINLVCKQHGLDWKESNEQKIANIISSGISFKGVLCNDIFKPETTLTDRKKFINDFCDKSLQISPSIKGTLLEEKIENLINHFEEIEKDDKVGISIDGYEKLLLELKEDMPKLNDIIKNAFELQDEFTLKSDLLLDYNIKPRDIIELIDSKSLLSFCQLNSIKTRGDIILNILEAYKDSENLYIENYVNIGYRNYNALKENGLALKEAEIGVKFEDVTKNIFTTLGFNVDETLRKKINTSKDKIDILLNLGNNELILIECKTVKESGFNKFSSVSRQLKAYTNLAKINDYKVIKSLLIAPEFSDDFIKECGLEYELNLSLIQASSLLKINNGFKSSKLKVFPHNLLMRDVLIQEDRVLKAIGK